MWSILDVVELRQGMADKIVWDVSDRKCLFPIFASKDLSISSAKHDNKTTQGTMKLCHKRLITFQKSNDLTLAQPSQLGNRFYSSESDVCRRQIPTYNDDSRIKRITICIMVVDP